MGANNNTDELQDILHDPTIGVDVQDRRDKLAKAKKIAQVINVTAIVYFIWGICYPIPYNMVVLVGIAIPLLALAILIKYKTLVNFINYKRKNGVRPSLQETFIGCGGILLLRAFMDYKPLYYTKCIIPTLILWAFWCLALNPILPKIGIGKSKYDFIWASLFMLPYCYGAIVLCNCRYDQSKALHYQTTVVKKFETYNKGTSYYLTIDKWGSKKWPEDIKVSEVEYERVQERQVVIIDLKNGLFEIPWYYIRD